MKIRPAVAALAAAFIVALVGAPALAAGHTVEATDSNGGPPYRFVPSSITIAAGDSITWNNTGEAPHTATADDGSFDSGNLDPGQSFTQTFSEAGTISYHCNYHQSAGMVGTIVVEGAPGGGGGGGGGGTGGGGTTGAGATPEATPLPGTGPAPYVGPLAAVGLLSLLAGGAVLLRARRRRA